MYILFVFAEVKPKVLKMHINMAVVFTQCKITESWHVYRQEE